MSLRDGAILLALSTMVLSAAPPDTTSLPGESDTVGVVELSRSGTDSGVVARPGLNPPLVVGSSAVVPGLGQILGKRYVKGALFLSTEVIMGLVASNRYSAFKYDEQTARESRAAYVDSLRVFEPVAPDIRFFSDTAKTGMADWVAEHGDTSHANFATDSASWHGTYSRYLGSRMNYEVDKYDRDMSKAVFYHTACWAAGCYVYNVLDALDGAIVKDDTPRSPLVAGWLSVVPGLGLGQFYNGSYSKAGLIIMTHVSMGYMAYNYHQLMRQCERHIKEIDGSGIEERATTGAFLSQWEGKQKYAMRQRNTYLWYGLLFYLYGVMDAVVDAHLHDINHQMQLKPDLEVTLDGVRGGLTLSF